MYRFVCLLFLSALLVPRVAWSVVEAPSTPRSVVPDPNKVIIRTCYAMKVPGLTPDKPVVKEPRDTFVSLLRQRVTEGGMSVEIREGCRDDDDPQEIAVVMLLFTVEEQPEVPGAGIMVSELSFKAAGESQMVLIEMPKGGTPPARAEETATVMAAAVLKALGKKLPETVRPQTPPEVPGTSVAPANFRLTLPRTNRLILRGCYAGMSSTNAFPQNEVFEFWQNLVAEMAEAGFRGAGFAQCGDGDDPGGGIVAAVIFSAVPKTLGNGMRKIIRIYLKAPGEKWWVLAARIEEGESGPVSEVQYTAPLLAKPLVEAIRKAQRSPIP